MIFDILEKSGIKFDRQKYVIKLKEAVAHSQELVERELEYIKQLKIKISEYDIYNQKNPYDTITTENPTSDSQTSTEPSNRPRGNPTMENNGRATRDSDNEIDTSDIPNF